MITRHTRVYNIYVTGFENRIHFTFSTLPQQHRKLIISNRTCYLCNVMISLSPGTVGDMAHGQLLSKKVIFVSKEGRGRHSEYLRSVSCYSGENK